MEQFSTPEQQAKWMPLTVNYKIHGCYAQTEIGHGSDVASLESTATFDPKTDEFVMHSPTISSAKWWPGDMGRYSNYAIIFAHLVIPDEDGDENRYGL